MARVVGFLSLPDVVLFQICSLFCPHCVGEDCVSGFELPKCFHGAEYFGTLNALTRVNVRVGRLAQKIRFHVFCSVSNSLPRFARTLVGNPVLAGHVCVVRLGDRDRDTEERCILRDLAAPDHFERLKQLAMPEAAATFDIMSLLGELRLLAKFNQLPAIEDSIWYGPRAFDAFWGFPPKFRIPPVWLPAHGSYAVLNGRIPATDLVTKARLNAFIVFKLAKNITSLVILSEWPLALFPETRPGPRIKVKQAKAESESQPNLGIDAGTMPRVQELRLDTSNENPHFHSGKCIVDIGKTAGLLARLPSLRKLIIRGGDSIFTPDQANLCRPGLGNLMTLDLSSTTGLTVQSILQGCTVGKLTCFRYIIPAINDSARRPAHDMQGSTLVKLLNQTGFAGGLQGLYIDTSRSTMFGAIHHSDIHNDGFETVSTLRGFDSLRYLSISIDSIYCPSLYPRVLLRDKHINPYGPEDDHQRLVRFLPRPCLRTVEITGVYALHMEDVAHLAEGSMIVPHPNRPGEMWRRFPRLRRVIFKAGGEPLRVSHTPYPFPKPKGDKDEKDDEDEPPLDSWVALEERAQAAGPEINKEIKALFQKAHVKYDFDEPEFFFDQFAANCDDGH